MDGMADRPNTRVKSERFNKVGLIAVRLPLIQRIELEERAARAGESLSDFMRVYILYPFLNGKG
jgi:hypothetical protein